MEVLSLAQAVGHTLKSPNGSRKTISSLNPYSKMLTWDGYSVFQNTEGETIGGDPCFGFLAWEDTKAFGVEIVPTPEELVMIERGRLSLKVEEKARELRAAIEGWLFNEKAR